MPTERTSRTLPPRAARIVAAQDIQAQAASEVEEPLAKRPCTAHAGFLRIPAGCDEFTLSDLNVYPRSLPVVFDRVLPFPSACEHNAKARLECMQCSADCPNMRLQRDEWPKCEVRKTAHSGFGYFAPEHTHLPRGAVIGQYTGKVFHATKLSHLRKQVYIMELDRDAGLYLDAKDVGYYTRFMNHSCEPNCELQKWNVCGLPCVGIFALRDIEPGEELTFDYGVKFGDAKAFVCKCPKCFPLGY